MVGLALIMSLVSAGEWVDLTWDTALTHARGRAARGAALERALDQAVAHTTKDLQVRFSRAVKAHVHTKSNYRTRYGDTMGANVAAHYRAGAIHINGGSEVDGAFVALVSHEMVHALLDHRGRGRNFPSWFNEGLAERARYRVLQETAPTLDHRKQLRAAVRNRAMGALPKHRGLTPSEYLTSWLAVDHLEAQVGEQKIREIVHRVIVGEDFARVFATAAGMSANSFEKDFRRAIGAKSTTAPRLRFK